MCENSSEAQQAARATVKQIMGGFAMQLSGKEAIKKLPSKVY
jgi:hypothetical protein